ncbi:MAG TPA: DUF89 family protein [Prosthecochloris aestuarii]|uniref:DUF89 family protein n=1 Tax=Prosthecochloris aestuarii TaxID=1102 RepID=A0A831SQY7_PROAE|nr:DUF89 family protein [Prosthecochloris aestuarii]
MDTTLDCIPCFMRQALKAGRLATENEHIHKQLLDYVASIVPDISPGMTPPEIGDGIYREVRRLTGVDDPFLELKQDNIREALDMLPQLEDLAARAADPLQTAVRIAIAGNVIDHGLQRDFLLENAVGEVLRQPFAVYDMDDFRSFLDNTSFVLYIGDNAGESVFDRVLISRLQKPVIYAVRDAPVINDVTMDDAIASGIDTMASIVSSGSTAPGAVPDRCSREFLELFGSAGLVISKGQGNYEALSGFGSNVFFLLRAKCPVIAGHLGVKVDDIVVKRNI